MLRAAERLLMNEYTMLTLELTSEVSGEEDAADQCRVLLLFHEKASMGIELDSGSKAIMH